MEGRGCSWSHRLLVQLILVVGAFVNVALCTLEEEISANSLTVRFDAFYDIDDWTSDMTDGFTSSVTTAVNDHCMESANAENCQISTYRDPFTVVLSSNSPEYFNGDIKMTFYVRIPEADRDPNAAMEYVLPLDVVTTIVKDNRLAINNATVEEKEENGIVFIGSERFIPLDNHLDTIMIPIVCVLFLLVVLLAIVLTCMQSRGEKKIQEQRAQRIGIKGDENVELTAVKSGSYGDDNNDVQLVVDAKPAEEKADTTTLTTATKKFRRQKKLKEGRENSTRTPVQVQPKVQSSSNGSRTSIEVKPADHPTDNFSANNSNDLISQPRRSGSRHAIELPPLTTVSTPRSMSLDGSDSEDKDRKKKKKKHHRKHSKQSLVDALDKEDEYEDEKNLSPLPEDNQGS